MDDARTLFAADTGERLAVVQQGVDQGAVVVTRCRVNDHTGGFVDDHQGIVLKHDVERDVFRHQASRLGRRHLKTKTLASPHPVARRGSASGEFNTVVVDEALDLGAGKIGQGLS